MLKRFELETVIRALVVVGVIALVALTLLFVREQPALSPIVVTTLLGLLATIVWYYFPRKP